MSEPPGTGAEMQRLLRLATRDPEAVLSRLRRALGLLRARWLFRRCECGPRVNAAGRVCVDARGRVKLGERVQFWPGMIPQELVCAEGAELTVGAYSMFNYGTSLRASRSIQIGARCMFGSLVLIHDANRERVAPVVIEDDVWVAHGAIVEPGVTIGRGSVVSAGSVVVSDVPPGSLAVGNPAKCVPLSPAEKHS